MQCHHPHHECMNCKATLPAAVLHHSVSFLGYPLCVSCQEKLGNKLKTIRRETIKLYFSLKQRGIPAELEKFDGYKNIDIAVMDTRVNIEVDEPLHHCNPKQALEELKRSFYFLKKGYSTLHIPNALVAYQLDETADYITELFQSSRPLQRSYRS